MYFFTLSRHYFFFLFFFHHATSSVETIITIYTCKRELNVDANIILYILTDRGTHSHDGGTVDAIAG